MPPRRLASEIDAFAAQSGALAAWLGELSADDFVAATVLSGWDVRTLVAHVLLIQEGLGRVLATRSTRPPVPAAEYVRRYRTEVDAIAASTARTAGDRTPAELVGALRDVQSSVAAADGVADRAVLDGPRGAIAALDWVTTRTVDVVVHCDDLSRTFPDREPVPLCRPALATAVRTLAQILAAQAPGHSVELRVPPYIAVQAVDGPRHTRGTPPNVVETDPLTWLRIATGRQTFDDALTGNSITASGNRADLTPYLPLLS